MCVGAVVVLYNPEIELLKRNINSIVAEGVECIVLVNNSKDISLDMSGFADKVKLISEPENVGIAKALNDGIKYLRSNGFKYALTMDQDSEIEKGSVQKLLDNFSDDVAICGCRYIDRNRDSKNKNNNVREEVKIIITSGNLLKISAWSEVGGFQEKLFIDCVDFDICLRLRRKGYKIIQVNNAILNHSVGEVTPRKFLFLKRYPSNHSSFRVYYIFRNNVYMIRTWIFREPVLMLNRTRTLINRTIDILLFEKQKFKKMRQIIKGSVTGLFMRVKKK